MLRWVLYHSVTENIFVYMYHIDVFLLILGIYLLRNISKMTDTGIYWSTPRRGLVSESDTDPMNSTVNPTGNPNFFVPLREPSLILTYIFPGSCLPSQWEGIEARTNRILDWNWELMNWNRQLGIFLLHPRKFIKSIIFYPKLSGNYQTKLFWPWCLLWSIEILWIWKIF